MRMSPPRGRSRSVPADQRGALSGTAWWSESRSQAATIPGLWTHVPGARPGSIGRPQAAQRVVSRSVMQEASQSGAATRPDHGIDAAAGRRPRALLGDEAPSRSDRARRARPRPRPGPARPRPSGAPVAGSIGRWPTRNRVPPGATPPPSAAPSPRPIPRRGRTGRRPGRTRRAGASRSPRSASTQSMRSAMSGPMASAVDRAYARAVAAKSTAVTCHPRAASQSVSDPWPQPASSAVRDAGRRSRRSGGRSGAAARRDRRARAGPASSARPRSLGRSRSCGAGTQFGRASHLRETLPGPLQWTRPALPRRPKAFPHRFPRAQSIGEFLAEGVTVDEPPPRQVLLCTPPYDRIPSAARPGSLADTGDLPRDPKGGRWLSIYCCLGSESELGRVLRISVVSRCLDVSPGPRLAY